MLVLLESEGHLIFLFKIDNVYICQKLGTFSLEDKNQVVSIWNKLYKF